MFFINIYTYTYIYIYIYIYIYGQVGKADRETHYKCIHVAAMQLNALFSKLCCTTSYSFTNFSEVVPLTERLNMQWHANQWPANQLPANQWSALLWPANQSAAHNIACPALYALNRSLPSGINCKMVPLSVLAGQ